jgi:AraC-like DNA-binding protein
VKSLSKTDIEQLPFLWSHGIAARETLKYLDRKGIDATPPLADAGLSRNQLTRKPGGVSAASQHRFLEVAADQADDPLLGLHIAAEMDLRDIGLLYYLQASSATVSDALKRLARYAATASEEISLEIAISHHEGEALLTFRRMLPIGGPCRQHSELIALAFNRVLRVLTNRDFAPLRMSFAHARNSGLREIHRMLRCPVEFAQAADSWVLPQSVMELPIVSEDGRLLEILEAHGDDLLSERRKTTGLRGSVENQLLSALPSGRVQTAVIAEQLGMSVRSFTRHLAQEGTSFSEVLDQVRHRLALRYLEDEHVALQQIAWLLGYSEIGAFNHAFKRWEGTSPGQTRRARSVSTTPG